MAKAQKQTTPLAKPAAPARPAPQKTEPKKKPFPIQWSLAILLGVIAFAFYANTANNDYALDDFTVIKNNNIVTKGISAIPEIFGTPYRRGWFITTNDLYRPMSLAMFAAEWQIFDKKPGASHVVNVLVFAGCVIFLFLFLYELFDRKKLAVPFIAALLFALHPIHTEVVANIKSRDELLCFFFAFLALNVFMKYLKTGKMMHLLVGGLCFFCSFMSKETVISFLFVIPFIFFLLSNQDKKRSVYITSVSVLVTVLFLIIRYSVLHAYGANTSSDVTFMDNFLVEPPSAISGLATKILILGKYLLLLLIPYPLVCDYSYDSIPFVTFSNIGVLLSLIVYIALTGFSFVRLARDRKDPYAFAILFYLATIALFSNIPFLIGAPMAERFVFFGSVSFCLVAALLLEQFVGQTNEGGLALLKNTKILAIVVPICLIYGFITVNRNADWLDNITLFRADVTKAPNDSRLTFYTGTELIVTYAKAEGNPEMKKKYTDEGIGYLRKSIATYEKYTDAHSSLGDAFFMINELDSAEYHGVRALQLNPKYALAINNLAGVYFMRNNFEKAIDMCRQALAINPSYVNAYSNMGLGYMRLGKFDSSLANIRRAIAIDPNFAGAYENAVLTFRAMGKNDSASKYEGLRARLQTAQ